MFVESKYPRVFTYLSHVFTDLQVLNSASFSRIFFIQLSLVQEKCEIANRKRKTRKLIKPRKSAFKNINRVAESN